MQARNQGGGGKGDRAPPLNPSAPPPLEEEIVQWQCPLIDRVVFYEKLSFFMGWFLWASNMPKNASAKYIPGWVGA